MIEPEAHRQQSVERDGLTLPKIPLEHLKFQSLSEYACARMLEKYTDWRAVQGVTYQVQVGKAYFDFIVSNSLIEYHPISLRREFLTNNLSPILSAMHKLRSQDKAKVIKALSAELAAQYEKRRKQTASAHPSYKDCDVVCAFSQEDFVSKVIYRFSNQRCPPQQDLLAEFKRLQKEAKTMLHEARH